MLIHIGKTIHNFLTKLFANNLKYVGRIYALGVMIFVVILRFSLKIGKGNNDK
jgi:hypothetical protein